MSRAGIVVVSLAASCLAASCTPAPDPDVIYVEDFETLCEGTPCGWVQSRGPDGAAAWIETIPGDHGLELVGDDVFVRAANPAALDAPRLADVVAVRMNARCDGESDLTVRVSVEESTGTATLTTFEAVVLPGDAWDERMSDEAMDPVVGESRRWSISRLLGISILKRGAGSCEIDYLAFRVSRTF